MSHAGGRSRVLRRFAALAAGLLLTVSALQTSFAQGGSSADYDDDGGGAAVIVGGVAAAAGLAAAFGLFGAGAAVGAGAFAIGAPHDCKERYPTLPPEHTQISEIRLYPAQTTLDAGMCRCFHLEVKSGTDRKWYSVTNRVESTINVLDPTTCVVKQEGSKAIFCVPLTAPRSCNGQSVLIRGVFAPSGTAPLSATSRVLVRVTSGDPALTGTER